MDEMTQEEIDILTMLAEKLLQCDLDEAGELIISSGDYSVRLIPPMAQPVVGISYT